jgi:MoxR-like ATPase
MPQLASLFKETRLIVVKAPTEDGALAYVQAELARAGMNKVPLWQCGGKKPLKHVAGPQEGPAPPQPRPGSSAAALAVQAFQTWKGTAVLLVQGADDLGHDPEFPDLLFQQFNDPSIQPWLLLVSKGGHPPGLPAPIEDDLDRFTADPAAERHPSPVAARPGAPPDLRDLKNLADFDSPRWTSYLDELPPAQLRTICEQGLYQPCLTRVRSVRLGLKKVFVQKDDVIDLMLWCTIAGLPLLLLGTWGTGKSMLVRQLSTALGIAPRQRRIDTEDEFIARLAAAKGGAGQGPSARRLAQQLLQQESQARHFEYLVTRFTTPEELLGSVDVELLLSHAIHFRLTHALMPRAEIVFLDEVFKANSAILNALLSLIHEKLFYNAGVPWTVNLVMLFGASNEPPQDEDLGAFYDRFPARVLCLPVGNDHLHDLLDHAHTQHYASLLGPSATKDEIAALDHKNRLRDRRLGKLACVNDFRLLRKVCLYRFGGLELADPDRPDATRFLERFELLFKNLRHAYDISDRSFAHFYRLARARAMLEGRDALVPEDCKVLAYCGKTPEALRQLPPIVESFL